jgi:hypothetical protein
MPGRLFLQPTQVLGVNGPLLLERSYPLLTDDLQFSQARLFCSQRSRKLLPRLPVSTEKVCQAPWKWRLTSPLQVPTPHPASLVLQQPHSQAQAYQLSDGRTEFHNSHVFTVQFSVI